MKSFTWTKGRMVTGFDIEAAAIRSFAFDKVVKWLPVPEEHRNASGGKLRRRGRLASPCDVPALGEREIPTHRRRRSGFLGRLFGR